MKIGLNYAYGANPGHDVGLLRTLVQTMESLGYASLWMPEHVVGFPPGAYRSKYPYSPDGSVPWQGDLSLHDPLFIAAAAAQMTTGLRFGSGIVILPQRPALLTAKELMTLDHLSGGRFEFGVGGGWSSEEYEALGVPFEGRGRRFDEYIEAIRVAWRDNPASYRGETISFDDVVLMPKPLTAGGPPILIGGSSNAALTRAARLGDGWFGHWTDAHDPAAEVERLEHKLAAAGRSSTDGFLLKASLVHAGSPDSLEAKLARVRQLGVAELVLIVPVRTRSLEADLELWAGAAGLSGQMPGTG
jgi:probable F420-dependent oxidoreductase